MNKSSWKKLASKITYKNKWYSIRQDKVIRPNGQPGEYNVIQRTPAVFIVAIDDSQNVKLINLYRYPTARYSLEIPGGASDGQKPLIAAKRELQEETGFKARTWKLIGKFQVANGLTDEIGYVYLASNLVMTKHNDQEEEGIESVISMPLREAIELVIKGKITDGQTIIALHYAAAALLK